MAEGNDKQSEQEVTTNPSESSSNISHEIEAEVLRKKIDELEKFVSQLKDQLLRKAAEFDNYKKRSENDYASMLKFFNEELIVELLPVLDDFERSMKVHEQSEKSQPAAEPNQENNSSDDYRRGVELIFNKLTKILESQGIKHFEVVGKPFDPYFHDALMQTPRNDVPPHTVIQEVEKGYLLHDKVIRHAKVVVSGGEQLETTTPAAAESDRVNGETDPGNKE